MTTGNVRWGNRFLDVYGQEAGRWTEKTWSGGDRPPRTRLSLSGMTPEERRLYLYNARRVRKAPFEPHPYTCHISTIDIPLVTYWNKLGKYGNATPQAVTGIFGRPVFPSDPWTNNHHLELIAKLKDKVVGGGFNAAVSIAEMGQTCRFIGDVARRVAVLDRSFKKLVRKRYKVPPTHVVKSLRDDWLAYQYAVMPLLQDVKSAAETLATINNRKATNRFTVRSEVVNTDTGINPPYAWQNGNAVTRSGEQIIAFIHDGPNALLEASGITDPASVLWEKTRLSFVADWFLPVGDFLKAVSFWRSYEGTFVVTRKVVRSVSGFGASGTIYDVSGGTLSQTIVDIDRSVTTELAIPYPRLRGLGQSAKDLRHAISGVALMLPNGWLKR